MTDDASFDLDVSPPTWNDDDVVACDVFAGAGGFSLGAYLAGIKIAAAVELNGHACNTYRNNLVKTGLTSAKLYTEDVTALSPETLRREAGLDKHGCDILIGGPPCQGFSEHRINGAGIDDPRNKLLLRYFEFVRILRPTFFLVENVPGLLWARHRGFLNDFYRLADAAEYSVLEPAVLNARDYGVPQSRRRVFLLGFDRRTTSAPECWPGDGTYSERRHKA